MNQWMNLNGKEVSECEGAIIIINNKIHFCEGLSNRFQKFLKEVSPRRLLKFFF